jgi:TIGR03009 family protein
MRILRLLLVFGFAINAPAGLRCLAGDPAASVDSVLAKWEEASQKCRSLDAKLTVYHYDSVFGGDRATITQGRFYFEAPNLGRYEIRETAKGARNDWSGLSEAIIWTGKETLWIEGGARRCTRFSPAAMHSLLSQAQSKDQDWWSRALSGFLCQVARRFQEPQQLLPLAVGIRAAEVREHFEVTIERSGEEIVLKAVPKQPLDKTAYREIDVILNAKTYMTYATQMISPNGNERTVHVFDDQKVNQRPSDRDPLLNPDLSGLRVTDGLWEAPRDRNASCLTRLPGNGGKQ